MNALLSTLSDSSPPEGERLGEGAIIHSVSGTVSVLNA